ncbi:hypothetical protein CAEBREN_15345 [Caenorhabditis brenneri]|uniref:Uncharacterized protein n=1 Tax=Caenorhabditis brenneri TaxID=135651 RepID=G0N7H1_CAEBE|nr:hypothetical protein CAEBREN_15345 [Caenorhabditis brenneri]
MRKRGKRSEGGHSDVSKNGLKKWKEKIPRSNVTPASCRSEGGNSDVRKNGLKLEFHQVPTERFRKVPGLLRHKMLFTYSCCVLITKKHMYTPKIWKFWLVLIFILSNTLLKEPRVQAIFLSTLSSKCCFCIVEYTLAYTYHEKGAYLEIWAPCEICSKQHTPYEQPTLITLDYREKRMRRRAPVAWGNWELLELPFALLHSYSLTASMYTGALLVDYF